MEQPRFRHSSWPALGHSEKRCDGVEPVAQPRMPWDAAAGPGALWRYIPVGMSHSLGLAYPGTRRRAPAQGFATSYALSALLKTPKKESSGCGS